MSDSLGLSIGVANLGAARVRNAPVMRRSVLTLYEHRAPEVGVPDENPNRTESGLVLQGFIERIGDPSPWVAADGSTHRCDEFTVEALDAMARTVGYGAPVAIAVPARWPDGVITTLRNALQAKPALASNGVPPALISDVAAALAALRAKPGFPTDGVVAVCDFGASGTSVTLTDAASNLRQVGETVHYTDFSGDQIDQAILGHLYAYGTNFDNEDATGTAPVDSLTRRLDACRRAKEQLSAATVAIVPAEMPGSRKDVRLSRTALEGLISEPLDRFVATVGQMLQRTDMPAGLAAIALVGGGACIPLVTGRLSDRLHVPIVTTSTPMLSAAIGAAVLAQQRSSAAAGTVADGDAPTAMGQAAGAPTVMEPTHMAEDNADTAAQPGFGAAAPTDIARSAWAASAAAAAASESSADGAESGTYRALAWSQEAATGDEPLPYTGEDYSGDYPPPPTPVPRAGKTQRAKVDRYVVAYQRPPWYKRSPVLFSVAAAAAAIALLGVAVLAFKLNSANTKPAHSTSKVTTPSRPPANQPPPPPPPPATVTETSTTEATIAPPPPPPPSTVTMTPPTTTTTVRPTTTNPTTTWPTTTYPSTYPSTPTTTRPVIPIYPGPPYGQ